MLQTKNTALPWLTLGMLLSLVVLLVVSAGLAGQVTITDSGGIPAAADAVMNSIRSGDWQALDEMIAGSPGITPETGEENSVEQMIWEAYQNSLQWTCADTYQPDGRYVTLDISVTCLDIPGVTDAITGILGESSADENQRELLLQSTAEQVLKSEAPVKTSQITLIFLREKSQWKLIPNRALQALLSGFTVH